MPTTVVITRDVEDRYRGFLGSVMLEVSPGVYAHPRLSAAVRSRVWNVMTDWYGILRRGSIVMIWAETVANGGMGLQQLGEPPRDIVPHDGALLVRRPLGADALKSLGKRL
jgi:CRISPR-associated protein Cas2